VTFHVRIDQKGRGVKQDPAVIRVITSLTPGQKVKLD
jgi:hypothetical protein